MMSWSNRYNVELMIVIFDVYIAGFYVVVPLVTIFDANFKQAF